MKLTIEIELQPNMEELLIDEINDYCMDWFGKKPVLHKTDCYTPLGFDEGYAKGYADATSEAISEIHKNYRPNGV